MSRQPWFVYRSNGPGHLQGTPANLKGWAALIGMLVAIGAAIKLVVGLGMAIHPAVAIAGFVVTLVVGLLLTFRLVRAKGARIP